MEQVFNNDLDNNLACCGRLLRRRSGATASSGIPPASMTSSTPSAYWVSARRCLPAIWQHEAGFMVMGSVTGGSLERS